MATSAQTPAVKTTKTKRAPADLITRTKQQLDRAVLSQKVTSEQLAALGEHIAKLQAFMG